MGEGAAAKSAESLIAPREQAVPTTSKKELLALQAS
jgi:hypothetical protein